MSLIAVTVIGHDRPGIIAEATSALAELGINLEDSTMTRLRGHFAMMLLCEGDTTVSQVERALGDLAADGTLQVSAREVDRDEPGTSSGRPYVLTVHGGDRLGIVSAVTSVLARAGGNITDLTTRLTNDLYMVVAEVDLPVDADESVLAAELTAIGRQLGIDVALRAQETDVL
ncbi:ACT domain-containing protein [Actinobacteria bacterium YIM 96077]|uniref:Amino acid-binding protein n=1 Tax=Phytoactinopolyspora halophila TaxID=1981511 RepID=A0A329QHT2_9ACTN|nr:ACT domain-containing protein [Phytoactinopolyspora halophila]AYY14388.1 ACT domain-containing protein [Actinobacteria bacterium YIM 96077]RAW11890.1 amino acid-binding protein [Phytoactinopolyspora halophila]